MKTKPWTTFRKGDRVRLTKDARRRLRATPLWHKNGNHPSQCDGIGRITDARPPKWKQPGHGHVTVRFPKSVARLSPRLLEPA